ncbi:uncharacterized protein CLUP02_01830 [Colletotrichum lupini]|uniref:Uncharacterized protein n=1 Tax=Colletotrichum lupini TaxID=145971 RepID=A0A9Q8SD69_9PEZI|nr:uncharacterized protein CLUP02_01830 [Colletotrichum lupini]UQC75177.1 hypothetical protein CLUP02_01830 [Colletotrichum lupini]
MRPDSVCSYIDEHRYGLQSVVGTVCAIGGLTAEPWTSWHLQAQNDSSKSQSDYSTRDEATCRIPLCYGQHIDIVELAPVIYSTLVFYDLSFRGHFHLDFQFERPASFIMVKFGLLFSLRRTTPFFLHVHQPAVSMRSPSLTRNDSDHSQVFRCDARVHKTAYICSGYRGLAALSATMYTATQPQRRIIVTSQMQWRSYHQQDAELQKAAEHDNSDDAFAIH